MWLQAGVLACLLVATPCYSQGNWPGIKPIEWNNTLHDLGHAGAAALVIAGTGWVTNWPLKTRMGLGTVAWPVAVGVYDLFRWSDGKWSNINWTDEANDFTSYQLPWAYWFAKQDKWVSAIYTVLLYGTWLYWRHWIDPRTSLRDSFWWHGAVVGSYMAGMALVFDVEPLPTYLQASIVLTAREILQFTQGEGDWGDALSVLLPLPYVFER